MARRITRKELKRDEFVDATVDAGHWIEEHWRALATGVAILVVVGLAVGGWFWYGHRARQRSEELLAEGMSRYAEAEQGGFASRETLEQALHDFDAAIAKSGGSPSGQVALYYRGATLYRLGRPEEAIEALREVSGRAGNPGTLVGTARALLAEVYAASDQDDAAIQILQEMTEAENPTYPVDRALLELGKLYRAKGDEESARKAWQRIIDEFPASGAAAEARRLLAGPR